MLREARLKPEHAHLYPTLSLDHWYTAAALAGLVKGVRIVREGPATRITGRVLQNEHFEFRGGRDRSGSWAGMRTRRLDRHAERSRSGSQAAIEWLTTA